MLVDVGSLDEVGVVEGVRGFVVEVWRMMESGGGWDYECLWCGDV